MTQTHQTGSTAVRRVWLPETPRSFVAWTLAHGIQRKVIQRGARRGDLISRLAMEPGVVADPFAAYEELRGQGRIVDNGIIRASVDYAVCNEVLRSDHFGTAGGLPELPPLLRRIHQKVADQSALGPVDPPSMLAVDPPMHTHYRKQVARAFTARKVGRMADRVEVVAAELLDRLDAEQVGGQGRFDLIDRYAAQLPVAVIADLLGVAASDHPKLLEWGNKAATTLDPGLSWRQYRDAEDALRHMHAWFADHVARLRRNPGDDLISQLAMDEGPDALTQVELHQVGLLLLGAGFETTVNLIGNAVSMLDGHPDQLAWLQEDRERWPNAVEEVLRHQSPVQLTVRVARKEIEIGGDTLGEGAAVLLFLGGANRDPSVFENPAAFDVTRSNAGDHLGFSAGVHFCLGASLARLEAAVGLRALYERYPDLQLDGRSERRTTRVLRGFERLPVTTGARVVA